MIVEIKNDEVVSTLNTTSEKIYFCDEKSFIGLKPEFNNINIIEMFKNEVIRLENHLDVDVICLPSIENLVEDDHLYIFVCKDCLYFVGEDECLNYFKDKFVNGFNKSKGTLVKDFINFMINDYNDRITSYEQKVTDLEDKILNGDNIDDINPQLIHYKRRLLYWKRVFEELLDIIDYLIDDSNEFYNEEEIRRFNILKDKIDRIYNHITSLLEMLNEVREAYKSSVDLRQNNIMSILTIVSVIFLPLTLIVGWYGMNFQMPEFAYPMAYPIIIIVSIVVVLWCIYYFKKNKWF